MSTRCWPYHIESNSPSWQMAVNLHSNTSKPGKCCLSNWLMSWLNDEKSFYIISWNLYFYTFHTFIWVLSFGVTKYIYPVLFYMIVLYIFEHNFSELLFLLVNCQSFSIFENFFRDLFIYLFRVHVQTGGGAEGDRENLKQTPCWVRSLMGCSISQHWDHNLSGNLEQELGWLSHPGTSDIFIYDT